jgi:branched-chain amino acid transport system substrate-binding protein
MPGERRQPIVTVVSAKRTLAAVGVVLSVVLTGCTSTNPTSSAAASARPPIPPAAFSDHTGVTPTSVTIANISTLTGGLFKGALVGTQAYAAFVNSQGGVNGRKLVVQSYDDQFTGALNKQATQSALNQAFALVGGTTLEDSFGETVLAASPQFPNVSESLDPTTQKLENTFSAEPTGQGWPLGPLVYFKDRYPKQILHTGTIVADLPSTIDTWNNEHATMDHLGYKVLYDPSLPPSTSDFTANVVAMKNAGVEILFLEQEPENYASAVIRDLNQQNFHPVVVLGAPAYDQHLVADSGGPGAIDGAYLEQAESLYLGEDQAMIPAVGTFNTWVHSTDPGFTPDFFTLLGWLSGELFTQALRHAGTDPSRGSLLRALRHITSFTSGNLIPVTNPAGHVPVSCYLLGRITDGKFQRLDDPPVSGPTNGFRCDQPYYYP